MDRAKLKRGTFILTAGTLMATPGCLECKNGITVGPCCDDAGQDPSGGNDCRTCYGIFVTPPDGGDSGVVGFFLSDAGDGGTPDGGKNGT